MSDSIKVVEDFVDFETFALLTKQLGWQLVTDTQAEVHIDDETREAVEEEYDIESDVDAVRIYVP